MIVIFSFHQLQIKKRAKLLNITSTNTLNNKFDEKKFDEKKFDEKKFMGKHLYLIFFVFRHFEFFVQHKDQIRVY